MHDAHLFTDLMILFAVAFGAAMLMRLLRLPTLIGFLLAGVLAGPSGLHLLEKEGVEALSELGVVLLLFTIGLELSLKQLWELRREALLGGGLQLGLTAAVAGGVAYAFGLGVGEAIAVGMVISLSSTAVALRLLGEQDQLNAPHGRISLAMLLLQDMAVVPLTLLIPMLAGEGGGMSLLLVLGEAVVIVVLIVVLARRIMPWILERISAVRTREGTLLGVGAIVFAITWLTNWAGVSPALGAFLAGLIISETDHKHLAMAETAPFRDLLLAVFFVSVGMLIDLGALAANPIPPLLLGLVVYAGKTGLIAAIVRGLGYPWRVGMRSGASIGQVGEFSFVLLLLASEQGVMSDGTIQLMLAMAGITLFLTPGVVGLSNRAHQPRLDADLHPTERGDDTGPGTDPLVLIIGFGHSGRATAATLDALGIRYHALELNPATVRAEKKRGVSIDLGDATRPEVLHGAHIHEASAVVVTINDNQAVRPVLLRVRAETRDVPLIVRARFASDRDELLNLGATEVVPEETEGAITIADRVMRTFGVPWDVRLRHLEDLRAEGYRLRTSPLTASARAASDADPGLSPVVLEEGDAAVGRTLPELDLRRKTGVTVVAVIRDGKVRGDAAALPLQERDRLLISGTAEGVTQAREMLCGNPGGVESEDDDAPTA